MPPKTAEKSFPTVELRADRPEKMDRVEKLEKAAKMGADEAKDELLSAVEKDLAVEISKKIKAAEEEMKTPNIKATRILGT